jgi:hypothetical protein
LRDAEVHWGSGPFGSPFPAPRIETPPSKSVPNAPSLLSPSWHWGFSRVPLGLAQPKSPLPSLQ